MFADIEWEVLDHVEWGTGMKMRLCTNANTASDRKYIQIWSPMSKAWVKMYSYDIDTNWKKWKKHADLYNKRQKQS